MPASGSRSRTRASTSASASCGVRTTSAIRRSTASASVRKSCPTSTSRSRSTVACITTRPSRATTRFRSTDPFGNCALAGARCQIASFDLEYRVLKYAIGGTFNFGNSPVFLDFGYLRATGDQQGTRPVELHPQRSVTSDWVSTSKPRINPNEEPSVARPRVLSFAPFVSRRFAFGVLLGACVLRRRARFPSWLVVLTGRCAPETPRFSIHGKPRLDCSSLPPSMAPRLTDTPSHNAQSPH